MKMQATITIEYDDETKQLAVTKTSDPPIGELSPEDAVQNRAAVYATFAVAAIEAASKARCAACFWSVLQRLNQAADHEHAMNQTIAEQAGAGETKH